jgi:hypothetical protein
MEGGERKKCDSKKVKVYAENIYPHRSPEVSLLEVCVPLLAIIPLLFVDSCLRLFTLKRQRLTLKCLAGASLNSLVCE